MYLFYRCLWFSINKIGKEAKNPLHTHSLTHTYKIYIINGYYIRKWIIKGKKDEGEEEERRNWKWSEYKRLYPIVDGIHIIRKEKNQLFCVSIALHFNRYTMHMCTDKHTVCNMWVERNITWRERKKRVRKRGRENVAFFPTLTWLMMIQKWIKIKFLFIITSGAGGVLQNVLLQTPAHTHTDKTRKYTIWSKI